MQIAEEEEENRPSPLALISQDSSTSRLLPPNRRKIFPRWQDFKPSRFGQYSRAMRRGGENPVDSGHELRPTATLRFNNLVSDSVTDQLAHSVQLKFTHDVSAVGLGCFHADTQ